MKKSKSDKAAKAARRSSAESDRIFRTRMIRDTGYSPSTDEMRQLQSRWPMLAISRLFSGNEMDMVTTKILAWLCARDFPSLVSAMKLFVKFGRSIGEKNKALDSLSQMLKRGPSDFDAVKLVSAMFCVAGVQHALCVAETVRDDGRWDFYPWLVAIDGSGSHRVVAPAGYMRSGINERCFGGDFRDALTYSGEWSVNHARSMVDGVHGMPSVSARKSTAIGRGNFREIWNEERLDLSRSPFRGTGDGEEKAYISAYFDGLEEFAGFCREAGGIYFFPKMDQKELQNLSLAGSAGDAPAEGNLHQEEAPDDGVGENERQ